MDNNVEQLAAKSQTETAESTAAATGTAGAGVAVVTVASGAGPTPGANSSTFWKNSGRRVPGRPSPKRELEKAAAVGVAVGRGAAPGSGMVSTFTEYQKSVSDAWDMGDDEFCIISSTEAAAAAVGAGGGFRNPDGFPQPLISFWSPNRCGSFLPASVADGGSQRDRDALSKQPEP